MDYRFVDYLVEGIIDDFVDGEMPKSKFNSKSKSDGVVKTKIEREPRPLKLTNVVAENDFYTVVRVDNNHQLKNLSTGTFWGFSGNRKDNVKHFNIMSPYHTFYMAIKKSIGKKTKLRTFDGNAKADYKLIYPYYDKILIKCGRDGSIVYFNTGGFELRSGFVLNVPKYDFKFIWKTPSNWKKNTDGSYDVDGFVEIFDSLLIDGKIPYTFGKVSKHFDCSNCKTLISLEGSPREVGGDFDCSGCPELKNLVGAPRVLGGDFYCRGCIKLVNLDGCQDMITDKGFSSFDCSNCPNLKIEELSKLPDSFNGKVRHNIKESTFYYWDKKYQCSVLH